MCVLPPQGGRLHPCHLLLLLGVHAPAEEREDDQRSGHLLDGRKHPGCRWEETHAANAATVSSMLPPAVSK